MRRHSLILTALAALTLVLAAAGSWLVCRSFADSMDQAMTQATLQHQRDRFAVEDMLANQSQAGSAAYRDSYYPAAADRPLQGVAAVMANYLADQSAALGQAQAGYALLRSGGRLEYTTLPEAAYPAETLADLQAAGTDTLRLQNKTILLCSPLVFTSTFGDLWLVTATDVTPLYRARNTQLVGWLVLQALLSAAALATAYSYAAQRELNDRQARFVAALTHELKTPLTAMIGYADLLRSTELPTDARRRAADALYHESTRLESLSQQLLALQRLQNAPPPALGPVAVAPVFAAVARSLPDLNNPLQTDTPPQAAVLAEPVLLADLLRNLVLNAAKASDPAAPITLGCAPAPGGWRLTVQDRGKGIPPEALPHLTEPFYRADTARARADGGSGLGLALCAQIAAAFGSALQFASAPGRGTTVTLLLPAAQPEKGEANHETA